ncbi:hypothetical protein [Tenacibaculum salmonis]|uniref:hypothetical protein n=1 Tax=Tenacibaculum sp. P3-BQ1 TaxID=3232310 RepID=UPI0034DE1216
MKKYYSILLTFLCFTIITSCNDEEVISDKNPDDAINQIEETVLKANTVTENVLIQGAKLIEGTPPASNGDISFSVKETEQSAFLNKGFNININTNDDYKGAYILVKSTDGKNADSYIDVPYTSKDKKSVKKNTKKSFLSKKTTVKNNEIEVEVNFNTNIQPGKFCYFICIYNGQGYVSAPSEVCVEVEAWGGNSSIVGTWNFTKEVKTDEDEIKTTLVGEENCDDYTETINCGYNNTLSVAKAYCRTINSLPLTFNADGTFEFINSINYKELDYETSSETCSTVFINNIDTYQSKGNWAYDEEEQKLTLVQFEITETENGNVNNEVFVNGELSFNGKATIINSELIITEEYSDIYVTEEYKFYFNK